MALISDVHGNYAALTAVLLAVDRLGVDRVLCLGDTAGYYSEVNECCDLLRAREIFCLRGNHDEYLITESGCPRSTSANRCILYQKSIVTPENLAWLESLRPAAFVAGLDLVHGGWSNPLDEYVRPSEEYFSALKGTLFASAHSHVPCVWTGRIKKYCNPGSVGQPRDGDWRASFATWDGVDFKIHRIGYDVVSTQRRMAQAGFDSYYFENLRKGSRIGGKIDTVESLGER